MIEHISYAKVLHKRLIKTKNMFKKIVSNLPFSPSLVGELSSYAKRLKKEEISRRLGLVFISFTIIIQSLMYIQPNYFSTDSKTEQKQSHKTSVVPNDGVTRSIFASNLSQGFIDATSLPAQSNDQISYTISMKNTSKDQSLLSGFEVNVSDILEYSTITNKGGGVVSENGLLSWPIVSIQPESTQTRTFTIKIIDPIPANHTTGYSYDCQIDSVFGNSINITIEKPFIKHVETLISSLPSIGVLYNIALSFITLLVAAILFIRSRQLEKEIRIIRKDIGTGTL